MKKKLSTIIGVIVIIAVALGIMFAQRKGIKETTPIEIPPTATTTQQVIVAGSQSGYTPAVPFENTVFKIVAVNGKLAPKIGDYTASFTNGKVHAKFCNVMNGDYTITNFAVTAPSVISTMMYCEKPEGLMGIEQTFGKMLASGAEYTITGDVLELRSGDDKMIFQAK